MLIVVARLRVMTVVPLLQIKIIQIIIIIVIETQVTQHRPLSCDRQHDVCLEVRGEVIRTVLYCVLMLCTVICTLR